MYVVTCEWIGKIIVEAMQMPKSYRPSLQVITSAVREENYRNNMASRELQSQCKR